MCSLKPQNPKCCVARDAGNTAFWALLNEGMKWNLKPWFQVPFHTFIQQRGILGFGFNYDHLLN